MARDTVGRTFIEIGADMSPLIRDIDSAVKIMGETEAKLISQGRRIGTAFENAYNPAGKLEKQLAALGTQGRSSADIVKVYGDRIVSATDASIKHGATLTPLMQNYRNLALATEKTSDAMWQQRGAAQMLEGYLGVHLPKSVNTFLAKSEIIGPMLGAAFSATAIVALGGAVFELGRKFADSMGWIGKSAEEMDKARKEAEKFSESLTKAANEYARIGLSGSALKGVEAGQAATAAAAARQELESTRALITAAAERVRNPQWNIQPGQPLQIPTQAAMAAAEALKNLGITDENREARLQELLEKHMQTQGELNKLKKEAAVDTEKESIANLEKQLDLTLKTKTESEGWNLIISAQAKIWSETVQPELKAYAERQSELLKTQEALNKASEDFAKIQPRKDQELEFQIEAGLRWSKLVGKDQQKILDDQEKAGLQAIDRIRDSAGHIFDDLMTGSKNIFQDLLRTFESVFLAPVRIAFQNLAQWLFTGQKPAGGIFGGMMGSGGGGGSAWGGIGGFFSSLFGGKGTGTALSISSPAVMGATGSMFTGVVGAGTATAATVGAKSMSIGASAGVAAGMIGGQMVLQDAYKRGNAIEGAVGGAAMGMAAGFMIGSKIGAIGGPLGMAIGAGIGILAGSLVGLFGGGEAARQKEAARRAGVQAGYMTDTIGSQVYTTGFGYEGNVDVETNLMGRATARKSIVVNINNPQFLDASGVEKIAPSLQKAMSKWLLTGGSSLGDDIAWASGRL